MNDLLYVFPVLLALILCMANVYSMHRYRISNRKVFGLFAVTTVVCIAANAFIIAAFGRTGFQNIMLATVAIPYFVLFLIIAKNKISQIFFNFWTWVNIYAVIANFTKLINDLTFRSNIFEDLLVIVLLCAHLVLYQKYYKTYHSRILDLPNINWWLFSLVPILFEVLIVTSYKVAGIPEGFSRNYLLLAVIFALMLLVYILIAYTFQKTKHAVKNELEKTVYRQQLDAAEKQISFLRDSQVQTALHRHNMRHNLTAIDAFLSTENIRQAREYIKEIQSDIEMLSLRYFCENNLVNLLCSFFSGKAEQAGIRLDVDTVLPEKLHISDMELCAILSNGLENAIHAVSDLESTRRWIALYSSIRQDNLLIEIKNPYEGDVTIRDGLPVSNRDGHGYGCRSIQSIAAHKNGLCTFETNQGIFTLRVVLPVHHP